MTNNGGIEIKTINPAINEYCFAERLKSFTIILINNVLRYKDIIQTKKEISSEEIITWFLNDLIRETELAINVTKGIHFQSALTLINNAISKFPQNSEAVIQNLRDALTKITTQASNAYTKI